MIQKDIVEQMEKGFKIAFINQDTTSNLAFSASLCS
jgi:hypothetical protein